MLHAGVDGLNRLAIAWHLLQSVSKDVKATAAFSFYFTKKATKNIFTKIMFLPKATVSMWIAMVMLASPSIQAKTP